MKFLFFIFVCGFAATAHTAEKDTQESSEKLLELYEQSVDDTRVNRLKNRQENEAFKSLWLDRFLLALAENPAANSSKAIALKALGLANSLGKYEISIGLLKTMLAGAVAPRDQARCYRELGEAYLNYASNDVTKKEGRNYLQLGCKLGSLLVSEANVTDADRVEYAYCLYIYGQFIEKKFAEPAESAKAYHQAWMQAALVKDERERERAEDYIHSELHVWLEDGDKKRAAETLESMILLSKKMKMRFGPSRYTIDVARRFYGVGDEGFSDFVATWIRTHQVDDGTPFLKAYYADSLFRQGRYDEALPVYLALKEHDAAVLLNDDAQGLESQAGGFYAEVLCNLAFIYISKKMLAPAKEYASEFEKLVPKDQRLPVLKNYLVSLTRERSVSSTTPPRSFWFWVYTMCSVIALTVAFYWFRRLYARRQEHR